MPALIGFTRFEAVAPDVHGEYETAVEQAEIALDLQWYPAVENCGEGVFVQLRTDAVGEWLARPPVGRRLDDLSRGHRAWMESRRALRPFQVRAPSRVIPACCCTPSRAC